MNKAGAANAGADKFPHFKEDPAEEAAIKDIAKATMVSAGATRTVAIASIITVLITIFKGC